MNRLSILFFVLAQLTVWGASHGGAVHVGGYTKANGTYVAPHYRSAPDGNFNNNWSSKGNVNPYTGKPGTHVTPPHGGGGVSPGSATIVSHPSISTETAEVQSTSHRGPAEAPIRFEPATPSGDVGKAQVSSNAEDPILAYQKRDAAKGFPEAQFALGMRYMTGNGIPKDVGRGKELITTAADNGCERAREKRREFGQQEREAAAKARAELLK